MKTLLRLVMLLALAGLGACSSSDDSSDGPGTDACGVLGLNSRIVNGTLCSGSSAVVRLQITDGRGSTGFCTGSMLTSRDILTAAHCFFSPGPHSVVVDVNGSGVSTSNVSVHPQASESSAAVFNDVAVVTLNQAVNLPTLPIITTRTLEAGDVFSIFGYGLDENQNFDGQLRSGEMETTNVTENHVAALFQGDGSNTCSGDSGGPAILDFDNDGNTVVGIVGVTSTGTTANCVPGDYSLFANIQSPAVLNFLRSAAPGVQVR